MAFRTHFAIKTTLKWWLTRSLDHQAYLVVVRTIIPHLHFWVNGTRGLSEETRNARRVRAALPHWEQKAPSKEMPPPGHTLFLGAAHVQMTGHRGGEV